MWRWECAAATLFIGAVIDNPGLTYSDAWEWCVRYAILLGVAANAGTIKFEPGPGRDVLPDMRYNLCAASVAKSNRERGRLLEFPNVAAYWNSNRVRRIRRKKQ